MDPFARIESPQPSGVRFVAVLGLAIFLMTGGSSTAQTVPGRAEARFVKGTVVYTVGDGPARPLKARTVLPPGSVVKTGPASLVDLFLGNTAGTLRVTENSTLSLERLTFTDTGVDTVVDVQLNLSEGQILGNVNKLSPASRYEIKVPNGVAGIRGTRYRCRSNSEIVLVNGMMIFVRVVPGGEPVPYTLRAPPAVEFTPADGVKLASPETVQQVLSQLGPSQRADAQDFQPRPAQAEIEPFVSPTTGARAN